MKNRREKHVPHMMLLLEFSLELKQYLLKIRILNCRFGIPLDSRTSRIIISKIMWSEIYRDKFQRLSKSINCLQNSSISHLGKDIKWKLTVVIQSRLIIAEPTLFHVHFYNFKATLWSEFYAPILISVSINLNIHLQILFNFNNIIFFFIQIKQQKMTIKQILLTFLLIVLINCSKYERMLQIDSSDPYCKIVDRKTGACQACICRSYFDQKRKCQLVSDICKTWNINTGECTSCYVGYQLINGTCPAIRFFNPDNQTQQVLQNPNCQTQDENGTCLTCRPYYILHCNDCQTTGQNPFCARYNQVNVCEQCDNNYQLDYNNICQLSDNSTDNQTDNSTCAQFSNCLQCNMSQCTKCTPDARQEYYSRNCVVPTTNCKQGCALCSVNQCFSCAEGYSAQSWPICINCSYMYARNSKGQCKAMQRDCSAFSNCQSCVKDQCLYCNSGYVLDANLNCVPSP